MTLDSIVAEFQAAEAAGQDVARLHSGDLSIWSALGEQLRRLDALGIPYTITPGVPAFAAAAAALGTELTLPEVAQSAGAHPHQRARLRHAVPQKRLSGFAATGATLAIHLSIHALDAVVAELVPHYGAECPAAVVYRASWPRGAGYSRHAGHHRRRRCGPTPIERTALILVGPVLARAELPRKRPL